jgi:hypothetical protein
VGHCQTLQEALSDQQASLLQCCVGQLYLRVTLKLSKEVVLCLLSVALYAAAAPAAASMLPSPLFWHCLTAELPTAISIYIKAIDMAEELVLAPWR